MSADAESAATAEEKLLDRPIRWQPMRQLDLQLNLAGDELVVPDPGFAERVLVSEVKLVASLGDGTLSVEQLQLQGDQGSLSMQGRLSPQHAGVAMDWRLQSRDLRLGLSGTSAGLDALPQHEIDLGLSTHGATPREMIAALKGHLVATGGTGRTTNTNLDDKLGPFTEDLVSRLNPFVDREAQTQVGCSAAALTVDKGVVLLEPGLVIRTDKIDTAARGSINLVTRVIDVQFHSVPRKGLGISASGLVRPFIRVGGTLQQPAIVLDGANALVAGAAAVATGGVSLLATSVLDRVATTGNPCEAVIERARQASPQTFTGGGGMLDGLFRLHGGKPVEAAPDDNQGTVLDLVE
jgi:hypothetical protein